MKVQDILELIATKPCFLATWNAGKLIAGTIVSASSSLTSGKLLLARQQCEVRDEQKWKPTPDDVVDLPPTTEFIQEPSGRIMFYQPNGALGYLYPEHMNPKNPQTY